ncbi:MAG: DUF4214 domain-containing protein, partial [Cellulomonadaceae bacterium]|nr:DUF4214 domain-containing protein [Cellulomonadaceae bacterium]
MIVRLVLSAVLALTGTTGVAALAVDTPSAAAAPQGVAVVPSDGIVGPDGTVLGAADETATDEAQGSADVTVTTVDVVLPAVDPSGDVVQTPELAEALAELDALAAGEALTGDRVASEVLETDGFQTLGVTWPADAPADGLDPQVRTRAADGTWSAWQGLAVADDAPDAGTADATSAVRGGTDPLWVGEADAVQVSFAAGAASGPDDLGLTLVDAPVEPTSTASGALATGEATTAPAVQLTSTSVASAVSAPRVISRAEWGARPQVCTPDVATRLVGAVVHHTAGTNAYSSVAQAEQQIRGDQAYHIDGRGWCDIGYNFIVDKWGNIYEGRANSLGQAVIGVHAGGFNTGTVGVSMLGTYDAAPSSATVQSVGQIIGWRLGAYGVAPQATMAYTTGAGQNSRFQNETVVLPRVMGHRDVAYTACPGNGGYAVLPAIRSIAAGIASQVAYVDSVARTKALYQDMLGRAPDSAGLAYWAARSATGGGPGLVATSLSTSVEYVQTRVREAYREILGRDPEPGGLASWTAEISSGHLRQEDLRGQLIASDEYFDDAGGTSTAYVAQLY